MTKRLVFLVGVVFTSMFAGATVANRLIRPDLSIPTNEQALKAIAERDKRSQ
jgi:hypothetical protein